MNHITQDQRLLRLADVARKAALSKASVYRLEREGRFPKRIKISEQRSAWVEHEIDAWIEEKKQERQP